MRPRLISNLVKHEGLKTSPYYDCCGKGRYECHCRIRGKLTIGVGRNLDDVGISREEAMFLMQNDIAKAERAASKFLPWFYQLDEVRQSVIIEMIFNLGILGLMKFKDFLQALEKHDYETATTEMLDSAWADQVGERAVTLATMMSSGKDPSLGPT